MFAVASHLKFKFYILQIGAAFIWSRSTRRDFPDGWWLCRRSSGEHFLSFMFVIQHIYEVSKNVSAYYVCHDFLHLCIILTKFVCFYLLLVHHSILSARIWCCDFLHLCIICNQWSSTHDLSRYTEHTMWFTGLPKWLVWRWM